MYADGRMGFEKRINSLINNSSIIKHTGNVNELFRLLQYIMSAKSAS